MYKCFDQIVRKLILKLAEKAGMDQKVLKAYGSFIENMDIFYQINGIVGEKHNHLCSIPQGCPFSMLMIALLMGPWAKLIKENNVTPRILADDLMFISSGKGHGTKAVDAMEKSREYFEDMGAKVADKKCFMSSTCQTTRRKLRDHIWNDSGLKLPVKNHFRDLGTHLCLDHSGAGVTLTDRIREATKMAKKLKYLPMSIKDKCQIIRSNVLSAGLYGVEFVKGSRTALHDLRTAIVDTIGARSAKRSTMATCEFSPKGADLDPCVQETLRRVTLFRRMITKHPNAQGKIRLLIKKYLQSGNVEGKAVGPVGFLICDLREKGMAIGDTLNIKQMDERDIHLLREPWQNLKKVVEQRVRKHRAESAAVKRKAFQGLKEIDKETLLRAMAKRSEAEIKLIRSQATAARWGNQQKCEIDYADEVLCELCGQVEKDRCHLFWECPCIKDRISDTYIKHIDPRDLTPTIKLGLPEAMTWQASTTF